MHTGRTPPLSQRTTWKASSCSTHGPPLACSPPENRFCLTLKSLSPRLLILGDKTHIGEKVTFTLFPHSENGVRLCVCICVLHTHKKHKTNQMETSVFGSESPRRQRTRVPVSKWKNTVLSTYSHTLAERPIRTPQKASSSLLFPGPGAQPTSPDRNASLSLRNAPSEGLLTKRN